MNTKDSWLAKLAVYEDVWPSSKNNQVCRCTHSIKQCYCRTAVFTLLGRLSRQAGEGEIFKNNRTRIPPFSFDFFRSILLEGYEWDLYACEHFSADASVEEKNCSNVWTSVRFNFPSLRSSSWKKYLARSLPSHASHSRPLYVERLCMSRRRRIFFFPHLRNFLIKPRDPIEWILRLCLQRFLFETVCGNVWKQPFYDPNLLHCLWQFPTPCT